MIASVVVGFSSSVPCSAGFKASSRLSRKEWVQLRQLLPGLRQFEGNRSARAESMCFPSPSERSTPPSEPFLRLLGARQEVPGTREAEAHRDKSEFFESRRATCDPLRGVESVCHSRPSGHDGFCGCTSSGIQKVAKGCQLLKIMKHIRAERCFTGLRASTARWCPGRGADWTSCRQLV